MTREEQIIEAGIDFTLRTRPMCIGGAAFDDAMREMNRNKSFEEGAKWADEHPNLYSDEKYHTVKVKDLDELNRKAKAYDQLILNVYGQIDRNQDSANIYTKQELLDMGFAFDLNGNIRTPDECYESSVRHLEYRKQKFIGKACEYLKANMQIPENVGNWYIESFIQQFRKAMEE